MSATEITANQLRKLLTECTNQELTIRELRKLLFELEDRYAESPVTPALLAFITR